jgi:hypothetical protein
MTYYMLYIREGDGEWSPEFGDTDRENVLSEKEAAHDYGWRERVKVTTVIHTFPRTPTQKQVNAMRDSMNEALREYKSKNPNFA